MVKSGNRQLPRPSKRDGVREGGKGPLFHEEEKKEPFEGKECELVKKGCPGGEKTCWANLKFIKEERGKIYFAGKLGTAC